MLSGRGVAKPISAACGGGSAIITNTPQQETCFLSLEDELFEQRAARVHEIEALGYRPFGKRFEFTHTIPVILHDYSDRSAEELVPPSPEAEKTRVTVAGRIQTV